jgi:hypothetical protein
VVNYGTQLDISSIQSRLADLGIYTGTIDGVAGKNTQKAISEFQKQNGLTQDGILGQTTLDELFTVSWRAWDLEPDTKAPAPKKTLWPKQSECTSFYGAPGENQTTLVLPYPMKLSWDKKQTILKFSVHEKVHDSTKRCFTRIADAYTEEKRIDLGLDLWGGCLNVRKMRGGSSWSMHSWGIAIDFDPDRNQMGWGKDKARLAKPDAETFWKIWEDEGWTSLGRTRNQDFMHVQAARL